MQGFTKPTHTQIAKGFKDSDFTMISDLAWWSLRIYYCRSTWTWMYRNILKVSLPCVKCVCNEKGIYEPAFFTGLTHTINLLKLHTWATYKAHPWPSGATRRQIGRNMVVRIDDLSRPAVCGTVAQWMCVSVFVNVMDLVISGCAEPFVWSLSGPLRLFWRRAAYLGKT